jgi:hypothetical protein
VLVALPRSRGVGVLCDEDREGKMGASDEEMMNSVAAMFMVVDDFF